MANPNKMIKYNVLDHGFIRHIDQMGDDLSIVRNARVSYDAAWRAGENEGSDTRLIHYLMKNGHNTPFEAVTFTFEVKAPIFVIRQWHRHRTQSYNEISARYKALPEEFYVPSPEVVGVQSSDNKQMRNLNDMTAKEARANKFAVNAIAGNAKEAFRVYHQLLKQGIPRELARSVLPLNTYTHMFATANLHNWFGFLRERLHPHAQWEIQQYAKAIFRVIYTTCPVATRAFAMANGFMDLIDEIKFEEAPAKESPTYDSSVRQVDASQPGTQPRLNNIYHSNQLQNAHYTYEDEPTGGVAEGVEENNAEIEALKRKVDQLEGNRASGVDAAQVPHHKHSEFNTVPTEKRERQTTADVAMVLGMKVVYDTDMPDNMLQIIDSDGQIVTTIHLPPNTHYPEASIVINPSRELG